MMPAVFSSLKVQMAHVLQPALSVVEFVSRHRQNDHRKKSI